jgi:predicted transcriptional regulator of viral defense system
MRTLSKIQDMNDIGRPNHECLFHAASTQMGYFTAVQARGCGFNPDLLIWHVKRGRYSRIRRGLYRLRDYPSSPREEIMAAWLSLRTDAVVSHESALELFDLGTIIPRSVHLTVPRTRRYAPRLPGVTIHTTVHPIGPAEHTVRDGIVVTTSARAIVDAALAGIGPEQVELAVTQALNRALTTKEELEGQARDKGARVQRLIAGAVAHNE